VRWGGKISYKYSGVVYLGNNNGCVVFVVVVLVVVIVC